MKLVFVGKRTNKLNVVAGYYDGKVLGQTTYSSNTDTEWFCLWFEFILIPLLPVSSFIVLDNASFHNKTFLSIIAEAYAHKILWLPKHSPDKNPIEHIWANMKKWLCNYSKNYLSIHLAIYNHFQ